MQKCRRAHLSVDVLIFIKSLVWLQANLNRKCLYLTGKFTVNIRKGDYSLLGCSDMVAKSVANEIFQGMKMQFVHELGPMHFHHLDIEA